MGISTTTQCLLAPLLWVAATLPAQQPEGGTAPLPDQELDQARRWQRHHLEGGIGITLPPEYRARVGDQGKVEAIGYQGKMTALTPYCLVRPFISHRGEQAGDYLRRVILPRYLELPDAALVRISAPRQDRATMLVRYTVKRISRYALVHCALQGRAGMAYFLSAPVKGFDQVRLSLARVAMSISFGGSREDGGKAADWAPGKQPAFITWRESREGAFSLQVPRGWAVTGSLHQDGAGQVLPLVRITSPGGKLQLFINDRSCGLYTRPAPALRVKGLFEGRLHFRQDGLAVPIRKELTPHDFLLTHLLPDQLGLEKVATHQPLALTDLTRHLPREGQAGAQAGGFHFTARYQGQAVQGFACCLTRTWRGGPDPDHWDVPALCGWVGRPNQHLPATRVLHRALTTLALDPDRLTLRPGWSVARVQEVNRFHGQLARLFDGKNKRSRKILALQASLAGPEPARLTWQDPTTGELFLAARGHNYYWRRLPSSGEEEDVAPPDLELSALLRF